MKLRLADDGIHDKNDGKENYKVVKLCFRHIHSRTLSYTHGSFTASAVELRDSIQRFAHCREQDQR